MQYGDLDNLGRATGVTACLFGNLDPGESATIRPPGYVKYNGMAACHLLSRELGGMDVQENLVTCYHASVNYPNMYWLFEYDVKRAVDSGQAVWFSAMPLYRGSNLVPYAIEMQAYGDGGLDLAITFINRRYGPNGVDQLG